MSLQRTRVKICGVTREEDARFAVALGVDAIGVILHADSPRLVNCDQAKVIRTVVPAFVSLVGVFVDCEADRINFLSTEIGLDLVQLHGAESDQFGAALCRPFIKTIRAKSAQQVGEQCSLFPSARALLLDPYIKGQHGGTGQQLHADLWPNKADHELILAGGLSPNNLSDSIQQFKPYAVDLNSGLEASPGIKDPDLIQQAMQKLHS